MTAHSWRRWAALLLTAATVAPVAAPLAAQQPAAQAGAPAGAQPVALSLEDAFRVAERESEAVRLAEAGVLRARGQQYQARSQYLPQINSSLNYQKALQNQFQAISRQAPAPVDTQTGPRLSSLCTPEIPATATPAERQAALGQAQTCAAAGGDALGGIAQIFASPYTLTLGLTGSVNLFTGGRVAAGNQIASASRRSAEIAVTAARAQLRLDVAQAYYNAVLADRLVTISESSYVQAERAFRQTSLSQQVGNVAEFDLLRAQVTRDNQRPVLIQARSQREVALLQLRQMLNLPSSQPVTLTTDLPVPPAPPAVLTRTAVLPPAPPPGAAPNAPGRAPVTNVSQGEGLLAVNAAEVLAEDPRVAAALDSTLATADTSARDRAPTRQARENITVQRNLLRQARAQRLPQIALSSAYQRFAYPSGGLLPLPSSINQTFPNWTASVSVSLPIFSGGRIRGDELIAEAGLREAEQTARQVEELSTLDAQTAIAQLAQAEATWLASAGTAQQATRAYTISEVRYREGIATLVELSDSRLMLQQAQWNTVTAARDLQIARLKLALLKDLPLSAAGAGAASASRTGAGSAAGASGGAGAGQGTQGSSSSTTQQRSAAGAAGGTQQAGVAGGGIP